MKDKTVVKTEVTASALLAEEVSRSDPQVQFAAVFVPFSVRK